MEPFLKDDSFIIVPQTELKLLEILENSFSLLLGSFLKEVVCNMER